jgi:hypothetical protein
MEITRKEYIEFLEHHYAKFPEEFKDSLLRIPSDLFNRLFLNVLKRRMEGIPFPLIDVNFSNFIITSFIWKDSFEKNERFWNRIHLIFHAIDFKKLKNTKEHIRRVITYLDIQREEDYEEVKNLRNEVWLKESEIKSFIKTGKVPNQLENKKVNMKKPIFEAGDVLYVDVDTHVDQCHGLVGTHVVVLKDFYGEDDDHDGEPPLLEVGDEDGWESEIRGEEVSNILDNPLQQFACDFAKFCKENHYDNIEFAYEMYTDMISNRLRKEHKDRIEEAHEDRSINAVK